MKDSVQSMLHCRWQHRLWFAGLSLSRVCCGLSECVSPYQCVSLILLFTSLRGLKSARPIGRVGCALWIFNFFVLVFSHLSPGFQDFNYTVTDMLISARGNIKIFPSKPIRKWLLPVKTLLFASKLLRESDACTTISVFHLPRLGISVWIFSSCRGGRCCWSLEETEKPWLALVFWDWGWRTDSWLVSPSGGRLLFFLILLHAPINLSN